MDIKKDKISPSKIFFLFRDEWDAYRQTFETFNNSLWIKFISDKNLGIACTKSCDAPSLDKYKILDEKKWAIAKIKYGL